MMMAIGLATTEFESRFAVNNTDGGDTKTWRASSPASRHQGRDPCECRRF